MKTKLITTLIAIAGMVLVAPTADAQCGTRFHGGYHQPHHASYVFISGYHRCGTPIYTERYLVGFDRFSRPIYGYRVIHHRPRHVRPAPRGYHVPAGPPPRHSSRGHVTIRF